MHETTTHPEAGVAYYEAIISEALEIAETVGLRTSVGQLRTVTPARQVTVYGADHDGLYQNGRTTKLRITSRDPEGELRIIGLTGNNVEIFEISLSGTPELAEVTGETLTALIGGMA